jgi:hypothetical protein
MKGNNELTLDADSDTSITASTDDQIDFEIAGADDFTMTANAFNVLTGSHATFADSANAKFGTGNDMLLYHDGTNSYITNAQGALKIATETSGIALTIGHTTSETTIADNLTTTGDTSVGGTLGVTGVATFATHVALGDSDILKLGAAPDMQLYHDGTNSYITNATGALKIATESSGIAVTIGHTTSEVTVADNLTVTGTLTLGSGAELTEAELEFLDGITAGTAAASKAMVLDSSADITGGRNLTISGELDAATGDFSGDVDVDGTMEADAYTLGGTSFIKIEGTNFTDSLLVGHSTTGTLNDATDNTGVGIGALDALTSGDNNTAVGQDAGTDLTTGTRNTMLGSGAGDSISSSVNNTVIGSLAGAAIVAAGHYNTLIGKSAGSNITSGDGNVVIGVINADSATGDRQLKITGYDGTTTTTWMDGDSSGNLVFPADVTLGDDLVLDSDSAVLKFGDDQDVTLTHTDGTGLTLNSTSKLTFGDAATYINQSSDGVMTVAGEATIDLTASTAVLVSNDLKLDSDSAVIGFGADNDTTLTHTDGTGLTLNSTNKLCFNDASQFIQGSSNAILALGATDEIDLTATAIDINGTCDVSGTLTNASAAVKVVGTETIWIPANAMTPTESNGCASITAVETTSGRPDMYVLDFDKDSDEFAQFTVAFPKSWNAGTVTYQVFWSGLAATGGVSWSVDAVAFANNDSINTVFGTAVVVDDTEQGAVEEVNVSAVSGAVTIAGSPGDDELCYFRIGRDVSDSNDDSGGDARLHGIKLFYTTDAKNDA